MFFFHNNDNDISKIVVNNNKWIDCLFFGLMSGPFLPFLSLSNRLALKLAQKHNKVQSLKMVQNWPRMTKIYLNDPKRLMNLIIGPFREPESDNFLWRDEGKEFPNLAACLVVYLYAYFLKYTKQICQYNVMGQSDVIFRGHSVHGEAWAISFLN